MLSVINNNKQLTLSLLVIMILMGLFWSGSRYPALNEKTAMIADLRFEDPLSFEAVFPVKPHFPLWKKVTCTNINWAHTNQQGMIFGVLLGAAFLTLIPLFRVRYFKGHFANNFFWGAIGAPLGVCAYCSWYAWCGDTHRDNIGDND